MSKWLLPLLAGLAVWFLFLKPSRASLAPGGDRAGSVDIWGGDWPDLSAGTGTYAHYGTPPYAPPDVAQQRRVLNMLDDLVAAQKRETQSNNEWIVG